MTLSLPFFLFLSIFFTATVQFSTSAAPIDDTRFGNCSSFLKDLVTPERVVEKWLPETETLFRNIVRKYPMATSEYIFVGRSPALLYAYLETQKEIFTDLHSWTLPISLKNNTSDRGALRRRFLEVYDSFRPREYENAPPRKRVYIDLVATGRTFAALERLLIETEKEGDFVGYSFQPAHAEEEFKKLHVTTPLTTFEISFALEGSTGEIKSIAPHPSLAIESEEPSANALKSEIKRESYKKALLKLQEELF